MKQLGGRVVAVTGAGSGIGRSLALEAHRRGGAVALCDVDEGTVAETARLVQAAGGTATRDVVDVAVRDAVEEWAGKVVTDHGRVDMIVNNAGVALGADVDAMRYVDAEWLMGVNFWGVVHGTKAFLPHLRASGGGHVVNVSSVFGLVGVPSQSAYNAAKFAVRGFTEALRIELDLDRASGVSCTTVHPGGIKTNIARNGRWDAATLEGLGGDRDAVIAKAERLFRTSPDKAAHVILDAAANNKRRVFIGADAHVFRALSVLPPGVYQNVIRLGAHMGR